jgi:putative membrane protein
MGLFWIVVLGLIAWAVVALVPATRGTINRLEGPREILDRRFARGEIDAEQYRQARAELGQVPR